MKRTGVLLAALLTAAVASAGPSWYGLSGFNFIPSARTGPQGTHLLAVDSDAAIASEFSLLPYSCRLCLTLLPGVEVGLTNTYRYYAQFQETYFGLALPAGGFVSPTSNTVVPFVPSCKVAFQDRAVPNGSLATGFEYPYGAFVTIDYVWLFGGGFALHAVGGMSTTVFTLYGLLGVSVGLPLGISITLEGAYGGKTDFLTRPNEVFGSVGVSYEITDRMGFDFIFRIDQDMERRLSVGWHASF